MKNNSIKKCLYQITEENEKYCYIYTLDNPSLYKITLDKFSSIGNSYSSPHLIVGKLISLIVIFFLTRTIDLKLRYILLIIVDIVVSCLVVNDSNKLMNWTVNEVLKITEPETNVNEKMNEVLSANKNIIVEKVIFTIVGICAELKFLIDCILVRDTFWWFILIPSLAAFIAIINASGSFIDDIKLYTKFKKTNNSPSNNE